MCCTISFHISSVFVSLHRRMKCVRVPRCMFYLRETDQLTIHAMTDVGMQSNERAKPHDFDAKYKCIDFLVIAWYFDHVINFTNTSNFQYPKLILIVLDGFSHHSQLAGQSCKNCNLPWTATATSGMNSVRWIRTIMARVILDFFCFYERLHFRSEEPVSFGGRKFMAAMR